MDALKILLAFVPMAITWGPVSKLWDWLFMWVAIALLVGGVEVVSIFGNAHWLSYVVLATFVPMIGFLMWLVGRVGNDLKTISRQFWVYHKQHPVMGWVNIGTAFGFFFYFTILHLGFGL